MSQPQQPQFDLKNIIMATALSMLIVFGWQYYYSGPAAKKAEQQAAQQQVTTQVAATTAEAVVAAHPRGGLPHGVRGDPDDRQRVREHERGVPVPRTVRVRVRHALGHRGDPGRRGLAPTEPGSRPAAHR